ncbi:MAG: TolC family protein [Betaproteobacteria bacterium]|nr:TolC family protein [Betaproteobacteria bacterium]
MSQHTPRRSPPGRGLAALLGLIFAGVSATSAAAPTYTLEALIDRALSESPALATSRAQQAEARAGLITARALPNPEIVIEPGRLVPRLAGEPAGASTALSLSQPIENPRLRVARSASAEARVGVALAETGVTQSRLVAAVRERFFELLRLRAEQQALQEDLILAEQIRDRIEVRVRAGEAPRFDSLRAEGEVAGVRRSLEATRLRIREAQVGMRQLVGPSLETDFELGTSDIDSRMLEEADYLALRRRVEDRNPEIALAREQWSAADRLTALERTRIVPQVAIRASHEHDPAARLTRLGLQVSLPLLDRREGPIAEAIAQTERARVALVQRRFETEAAFEAAWQAYQVARSQVQAIEGGVLARARQVLAIAEAAYRLGERGILEYLDAQRQFRLVRNDLIAARFDLQRARIELERLAGR